MKKDYKIVEAKGKQVIELDWNTYRAIVTGETPLGSIADDVAGTSKNSIAIREIEGIRNRSNSTTLTVSDGCFRMSRKELVRRYFEKELDQMDLANAKTCLEYLESLAKVYNPQKKQSGLREYESQMLDILRRILHVSPLKQ